MALSKLLSESRLDIVNLTKARGELSIDEAVDQLGLAKTTIRQHFNRLEQLGLVERKSRRQGRGRPKLVYNLTETGERLFPSGDKDIARELVRFLVDRGDEDAVEEFFANYWERRKSEFKLRVDAAGARTTDERLEVLRELLAEQGFMPEIDQSGNETCIKECNCPFSETVKSTRLPCRLEAEFMQWVVGDSAERVEFIPDGATACTYSFTED